MITWKYFLWPILIGALAASYSQAEIHLETETLSVNVHEMAILDVMHELSNQGEIRVVAMEDTKVNNVRISKIFWDLPLEEGLERLFNGWNYGLNRDQTTGKITTIYLVSQRLQSSDSPDLPQMASTRQSSNTHSSKTLSLPRILSETFDPDFKDFGEQDDIQDYEEEYADEQAYPDQEELESLPPNFRNELEKWYRNDNG